MAKFVLAGLAIVALAPVAAQASVVMPSPTVSSTDDFNLTELQEGIDRVLVSVDETSPDEQSAMAAVTGDPEQAFAGTARTRARSLHARSAYDGLDAASITDPIPEPATWLMMILGFFGLSFAVRRRGAVTGSRVRFS